MKALSKISDSEKLIGLISHVEVLKNEIDKKIVVEKRGGYSVIKDIVY